jgi:DNA-binding PadR family transcriptional regulator
VADPDPSSFLPLPQAQFHVLVALTDGERHGYAIMQAVESSSDGVVRMGPATLYGTLKRLVDQGLAEELAHRPGPDDDQRRRYYRLTGLGQRVCAAEAGRLAGLVRTTQRNLRPGMA